MEDWVLKLKGNIQASFLKKAFNFHFNLFKIYENKFSSLLGTKKNGIFNSHFGRHILQFYCKGALEISIFLDRELVYCNFIVCNK